MLQYEKKKTKSIWINYRIGNAEDITHHHHPKQINVNRKKANVR